MTEISKQLIKWWLDLFRNENKSTCYNCGNPMPKGESPGTCDSCKKKNSKEKGVIE